ncbi:MAG: helix-turn-helix transcriptional regulator, partial [Staphylococcus epidermidis]|nr:helix-turn-helix transcriptional regulator [Staphylococcus epidermidis]
MRTNDEIITIIKTTLKEQNMSLSELARRVGMAKSAVSRYLNLTREFPLNRAEDFANALHI